jgi:hypothetical protein
LGKARGSRRGQAFQSAEFYAIVNDDTVIAPKARPVLTAEEPFPADVRLNKAKGVLEV